MTNGGSAKKLRAGVIGVGYLGTFHAQKYKNNPLVDLVGVCDFNFSQAQKVADQLQVKPYARPEDMLGQVDLVTIATSTQAHYEVAKLFINDQIPVNVEKPITATLEQAESLVNLAEKRNVKLAVGHIERFNPAIVALKNQIKTPVSLELVRMSPFRARGSDVNVLYDLMIHDADLLFWLTGVNDFAQFEAIHVSGKKIVSQGLDTSLASIQIKNGPLVQINVSRVNPVVQRSIRVVDEGQILLANTGNLTIEKTIQNPSPVNADDQLLVLLSNVEKADALQSETNSFVEAVLHNKPLAVSGLDGLRAMRFIAELEARLGI